ncbi:MULTISPECIES: hypothetical protein [unclassified Mesorhizobium]|uniref:hypothetical protein n=1 Tax=unclassified Mesorhizobium TaxID=325217 RepID=UPI000FCA0536|nr:MULTISPECIES: hypothetical protein [unclassified Mesorhizobium]RUW01099.1 hypothetical protein EOA49_12340 [Mesorhizobium sp. M1A.F.Ca.IN.020.04.1.1]RUW09400.1 hypothetical protein EOA53_16750 [Mesorhizobium sp. M1A.F.Ca.IN.020.03.1.1]RWF75489.1 MAG: hypothetical protein EOQ34_01630 [Mesorhizobium sp.]RWG16717.1 MAG: hypothetical protein EOQ58_07300 [Mesorhizobium sp.]RWG33434.1 MAG: hypothetical protein EOQ61_08320 [Mesorhizobium sp.]
MANRAARITEADASRFLKAAKSAGFERARIVSHPDGRIECTVEMLAPSAERGDKPNEWDEVLE